MNDLQIELDRFRSKYHIILSRIKKIEGYARDLANTNVPIMQESYINAILRETHKASLD